MVPKLVPTRDLSRTGKRVPISLRNVIDQPIMLGARMLVGQVSAATPVFPEEIKDSKGGQQLQHVFQRGAEVLSPAWQKRMRSQLMGWEKIFSKIDFDVGCARRTQHRICLQEDKPFQERATIPLSDLEDLREQ